MFSDFVFYPIESVSCLGIGLLQSIEQLTRGSREDTILDTGEIFVSSGACSVVVWRVSTTEVLRVLIVFDVSSLRWRFGGAVINESEDVSSKQ